MWFCSFVSITKIVKVILIWKPIFLLHYFTHYKDSKSLKEIININSTKSSFKKKLFIIKKSYLLSIILHKHLLLSLLQFWSLKDCFIFYFYIHSIRMICIFLQIFRKVMMITYKRKKFKILFSTIYLKIIEILFE